MIHLISRPKKQFAVANVAKNGELLKISETLSSKAKCWQNIRSEMRDCYPMTIVEVQDDTFQTPKVFWLNGRTGYKDPSFNPPKTKYQPGKNKRVKK